MAKIFYTERDLEDLARQGVSQIELDDDVIVTDVAREKAEKLGVRLVRRKPGAPVGTGASGASGANMNARPERSVGFAPTIVPAPTSARSNSVDPALIARVRAAVQKQLEFDVDPQFLDKVISMVLDSLRS